MVFDEVIVEVVSAVDGFYVRVAFDALSGTVWHAANRSVVVLFSFCFGYCYA